MYLTFTAVLKRLFKVWAKTPDAEIAEVKKEDHSYIRGDIENRGPCPGLNSLANHGFIPRDGKNISLPRLEAALMEGLHMSHPLAATLVSILPPLLRADGTFDLVDVRRHNVLEHDASFTRLDFRQGDNYTFQPHMFEALLADAGPEGADITLKSLARTRIRRDKEQKASGAAAMPLNLWVTKWAETVAIFHANGKPTLSREDITALYTQEQFPKSMLEYNKQRTLRGLLHDTFAVLGYVTFGLTQ